LFEACTGRNAMRGQSPISIEKAAWRRTIRRAETVECSAGCDEAVGIGVPAEVSLYQVVAFDHLVSRLVDLPL
jgi:hypothetical protein